MTMKRFLSVFFVFTTLYFAGHLAVPNTACATATPPISGCDSNFMGQLNQKAFLEAQREIELNGRYIWKPDSVLAMTCFQQAMNHASVNLPEIFSEAKDSPRRQAAIDAGKAAPNVPSSTEYPDHFADNMAKMIGPVLKKYIGANFSHPFSSLAEAPDGVSVLGANDKLKGFGVYFDGNSFEEGNVGYDFVWGRQDATTPVVFQDLLRKDYRTPINDDCGWMRQMWDLAKCYSFDITDDFKDVAFRDVKTGDNLFSNQDLRGKSCGEGRPASAHGGKTVIGDIQRVLPAKSIIDGQTKNVTDIVAAETAFANPKFFDDVVSNFNSILDRTAAGGCGAAIPTGVEVIPTANQQANSPFPESFCPNPGCRFNKTSCVQN